MSRRFLSLMLPALLGFAGPATAQTDPAPITLTKASLSGARFVVLPARVEGDTNVVSSVQLQQAVAAINRNLPVSLKGRYPGATITTDVNDAGAVRVTPVLVAPKALNIFNQLDARLELQMPGDARTYVVKRSYGLLSLVTAGGNADMVVLNGLTTQLP
ncbi:hypothetical protein [Deinococcus maricopensis]|uniref:Uncharacterized protein n=1 Tax=Deinococcus maricopensis (strain DSM 21211 / LMG 22137 / NRRL B-23946 / LB-34) TaxID=709986 RepID=E8U7Y7_DEIML|nr:hypothetical protein [Deinococcus maricopensis]ADV67176.1 hypothetical protein Deima_1527 [Deinococcus maricopensis DSM 21211]